MTDFLAPRHRDVEASIVVAVHGGNDIPSWVEWDGTTTIVPERGVTRIDVVDAEGDDIGRLQNAFDLHELAVADLMSLAQLAKVDLYDDHVSVVVKVAKINDSKINDSKIEYTDISIFLSDRRIIAACRVETVFGHRLRERIGKIAARKVTSPKSVAHKVLDLIVDDYFSIVQMIAHEVLLMENCFLDDTLGWEDIARAFQLRRESIHFQHGLPRMIDACNKLANLDIPCISRDARPYFRDVLDHLARIHAMCDGLIDVIRTSMEASSLFDQQRQSQLVAWAGILAIATAISGIFGMSFVRAPSH